MSPEGIIGIIVILGGIILFHEFGHFIAARLSGMGVHEFSLGFGPALISKKRGKTTYALRMIPLGGYVRIAGMELEDSEEEQKAPDNFNNKPYVAKFMTIFAGALMNFVLALLLFIVIGMAIGYRDKYPQAIVEQVMADTPAAQAGIQPGDRFVEIADVRNPDSAQAVKTLRNSPPPIRLVIDRNGEQKTLTVVPVQEQGYELRGVRIHKVRAQIIGVGLKTELKQYNLPESIVQGSVQVYDRIRFAIANVLYLFSGEARPTDLGGPVQIMRLSYDASKGALLSREAMAGFLSTFALFSVLIGFFNLLPIPALDGSRLLFPLIYPSSISSCRTSLIS